MWGEIRLLWVFPLKMERTPFSNSSFLDIIQYSFNQAKILM
jgi:hypothetical protein